jgi:hypothetical protein
MQNKITHIVFILTQHLAQQIIQTTILTPLTSLQKILQARRYEVHPQQFLGKAFFGASIGQTGWLQLYELMQAARCCCAAVVWRVGVRVWV